MYALEILTTATDDLQDAFDWYKEQSLGLGDRYIKEVDNCLAFIKRNPKQYAVQFSEKYRFAPLRVFPFRIVYDLDEIRNIIYISAVFHTSRDPGQF